VSFATITRCVASQRVFIVVFVMDSVRKLLDTTSYLAKALMSDEMKYSYTASAILQGPLHDPGTAAADAGSTCPMYAGYK
jgi:hypothetical protein